MNRSKLERYTNNVKFLYIIIWMILLFFNNVLWTSQFTKIILPFMLPLGAFIIVFDFFKKRIKVFNIPYMLYVAFIMFYVVTIIVNYPNGVIGNIKSISWFIVVAFTAGYICEDTQLDELICKIKILAVIFVGITTIASLISLYSFFVNKEYFVELNDVIYKQGYHYNRLFGIYIEPNYAAGLAVVSIVMAFLIIKLYDNNNKIIKRMSIFSIVIQTLYFVLSNSRGALVTAIVTVALAEIIYFLKEREQTKKRNKKIVVAAAVFFPLTIIAFRRIIQYILLIISALVQYIKHIVDAIIGTEGTINNFTNSLNISSIERIEYGGTDISTGRLPAWKAGIETLIHKNPIFGLGESNIGLYVREQLPQLTTIGHNGTVNNGVIKLLVASGVVGTVIVASILIYYLITSLKMIQSNALNKYQRLVLEYSIVCAGALFTSAMFLEDLFLSTNVSTLIFWGCIGISFYLNKTRKKNVVDE